MSILEFSAGDHIVADQILLDQDYSCLRGQGCGVTKLYASNGIVMSGKNPIVKDLTLIGSNNVGTGLTLKNNYRATLRDIEIRGFETQLLSLCEWGHRQWLHNYYNVYLYEGEDGHARGNEGTIFGAKLLYTGDKDPESGWKDGGGFSNTHSFFGGRICVSGTPLYIDGPCDSRLFGVYIDMRIKPLFMSNRSASLQLFGTFLDRSSKARQLDIPVMILESPKFNRVKFFGQHLGLKGTGLIQDTCGNDVSDEVFLCPEKY